MLKCAATSKRKYPNAYEAKRNSMHLRKLIGAEGHNKAYRCKWCLGYHHTRMTRATYQKSKKRYFRRYPWARRFEEGKLIRPSENLSLDKSD